MQKTKYREQIKNKVTRKTLIIFLLAALLAFFLINILNAQTKIGYFLEEYPDGTIRNTGNEIDYYWLDNNRVAIAPGETLKKISETEFELSKGDIILGGDIKVVELTDRETVLDNGNEFKGVENAKIKLKNNEVAYAEFTSSNGGVYNFDYKDKVYSFTAGKKGKVLFDPENNKISGENSNLEYIRENGARDFSLDGNFNIQLDENGNVKSLTVDGVFRTDVFGGEKEFFSKGQTGELSVFYDGTDNIREFSGEAISIDLKNRKINMKGAVVAENLKGISYQGFSDTYTEFYNDGKPNQQGQSDGISYFDVENGDAIISNGVHEINLKNGEAFLKTQKGDSENPAKFKIEVGKDGEQTIGFIDSENDKFLLTSYINGKIHNTSETALSSLYGFSKEGLLSNNEIAEKQLAEIKSSYEKRIKEIDDEINNLASSKSSYEEVEMLELEKIILQNKLDSLSDNELAIESSIKRLEDFLNKPLKSKDARFSADIITGELKLEELTSLKAGYGSPLAEKMSKNAEEHFKKAITYAEKQLSRKDIELDPSKREELLDLRAQAYLGLGKSKLNYDRPRAENIFTHLTEDKPILIEGNIPNYYPQPQDFASDEAKSEAYRLLAISRLAQNPQGQIQFALQTLKKAVDTNPENSIAAENLRNLQTAVIDQRISEYYSESGKVTQDVFKIIGESSNSEFLELARAVAFDPLTTPYHALSGRLDEILLGQQKLLDDTNKRIIGADGLRTIIESGLEADYYVVSNNRQKLASIISLKNYDRTISSEEFLSYAHDLKFTPETRSQDITKLLDRVSRNRGTGIANRFFDDINKALITMDSIDFTIKTDPRMYLVANHGRDYAIVGDSLSVSYEGDISLGESFTIDRAGKPIERTWTEFGFEVADIGGTLVGAIGVVRGLGIGARALGIGAEKAFNIGRATLSPVETIVTAKTGSTVAGIASEAAFQIGTSVALVASGNPDAALVYDILTLAGRAPGKKLSKISVASDSLGNAQTIAVVDDVAYRSLKNSPRVSTLENGVLLAQDGRIYATQQIPKDLTEIVSFSTEVRGYSPISEIPTPIEPPKLRTAELDAWVNSDPQFSGIRKKLADNIQRVSFDEFKSNLDSSVRQLNSELVQARKPYVQLLGHNSHNSPRWTYELAREKISVPPKYTSYFNDEFEFAHSKSISTTTLAEGRNLERWLKEGVDTFVYIDDAAYSGKQFSVTVLQPLADTYTSSGTGRKPTIYFVAPYMSEHAKNSLIREAKIIGADLRIISQKNIKTLEEILTPEELALYRPYSKSSGVTYFDHKLPDVTSFDENIAKFIDKNKPPYKIRNTAFHQKTGREFSNYAANGNSFDPLEKSINDLIQQASVNLRVAQQYLGDLALESRSNAFPYYGYFSEQEFTRLHPDLPEILTYHNNQHTINVAQLAHEFAVARGLSSQEAKFIREVAILHDLDPHRTAGTSARVPETLKILDQDFRGEISLTGEKGRSVLREKFGWTENDLLKAKSIIQRTEFPFANEHPNPYYKNKGSSPVQEYKKYLEQLDPENRDFVLREAPLLSEYADKSSYYIKNFDVAFNSVKGLAKELNLPPDKIALTTKGFLEGIGTQESFEIDKQIARELGVPFNPLTRENAFEFLPNSYRENFQGNLRGFSTVNEVLSKGGSIDEAVIAGKAASTGSIKGMTKEQLFIEEEKYKYLIGNLNRPNPNFEGGQLEQLINDWTSSNPLAKETVSEYKRAYQEMNDLAEKAKVPLNDPRKYFNIHIKQNPTDSNYQRYKDAVDFHDLTRNKELREGFELLGILDNPEGRKLINELISQQVKPENLVGTGVVSGYKTENYRSIISGSNERKMILETRWTIIEGRREFGTAIPIRPTIKSRIQKNNINRVSSDGWIDRISVFRISLFMTKNFVNKLSYAFFINFVRLNSISKIY